MSQVTAEEIATRFQKNRVMKKNGKGARGGKWGCLKVINEDLQNQLYSEIEVMYRSEIKAVALRTMNDEFRALGVDEQDVEQEGRIGLMWCLQSFDASRGRPLHAFSHKSIRAGAQMLWQIHTSGKRVQKVIHGYQCNQCGVQSEGPSSCIKHHIGMMARASLKFPLKVDISVGMEDEESGMADLQLVYNEVPIDVKLRVKMFFDKVLNLSAPVERFTGATLERIKGIVKKLDERQQKEFKEILALFVRNKWELSSIWN